MSSQSTYAMVLMAPQKAICRIRVKCLSPNTNDINSTSTKRLVFRQRDFNNDSTSRVTLRSLSDSECLDIPLEIRIQWAKLIAKSFCERSESPQHDIRDWDMVLNLDGSIQNIAENLSKPSTFVCSSPEKEQLRVYPARYKVPKAVTDRLGSDQEKVLYAELFALGSIIYELMTFRKPYHDHTHDRNGDTEIQSWYAEGNFPDDIWDLPGSVKILGCWCPEFAKELLNSSKNRSILNRTGDYIKQHPVRFSLQVLGGITTIASLIAVPVLGLVGFSAAGPVAGSTAAAWQASIGLVEAGSLFAWCQSAAMGGAAVSGVVATGLVGATVSAGAGASVALERGKPVHVLRETFLKAWKRQIGKEDEASGKFVI